MRQVEMRSSMTFGQVSETALGHFASATLHGETPPSLDSDQAAISMLEVECIGQ